MNPNLIYGMTVMVIYLLSVICWVAGDTLNKYARWTLWSIVGIFGGTLLFKLLIALIMDV